MKTKKWIVVCLCVSLFSPFSVFGATFDNIVVFGDSLSDNGNLYALTGGTTPDPLYFYEGRYSNGRVWVEYLADPGFFDCTLDDHAYGGAETGSETFPPSPPGLITQVTTYTGATMQVPDNALFVIWIGANDMFAIVDPADAPAVIAGAVANIQTAMEDLAAFGAEDFLILNLPNLGATPAYYGTAGAASATQISQAFNAALAQVVLNFETVNPDVTVYEMNIYDLLETIVANPSEYGFTNVTEVSPNFAVANEWDSQGYLFWNDVHPTTQAHEAIAEKAYDLLNPDEDTGGDNSTGCFVESIFSYQ